MPANHTSRRPRARGRALSLTTCLALGLTACGSTVQQASSLPGSQANAGLGTGPETLSAGTGSTSTPAQAQGAVVTSNGGAAAAGGTGSSVGTTPDATTVSGGTRSGTSVVHARGVTATTITVGIPIPSDTSGVATAFGISGAGSVAPQDIVTTLTDDINKSGGILGRKLVSYVHPYSLASYIANPTQSDEQVCSDFRDDHKVFSVIFNLVDDYMRQCTAAMGSPLIILNGNQAYLPAADYRAHGGNFLYGPTAVTAERLAQLFVQSLVARKFVQPWNILSGGPGSSPPRLGLIHVDTPDQNAYYADIAKELAKYGLKFTSTFTYARDANAAFAGTQSAVLKFKSAGITHVFGASAFFLDDAESQKYYPRYAYLPGLGQLGAQNVPADQMNGALSVGWAPTIDVAADQDPGDTPGAKHCRDVMTRAGLSVANRSDLETMYSACDSLYSFRAALDAGGTPTVQGLRAGYEALGSGFPSALSFGVRLGPGRHSGIDSVRDIAWNSACGCLTYTSRTGRS